MSEILDVMERYGTLAGYSILTNEYMNFYSDIYHIEHNCEGVGVGLSSRFSSIKSRISFLDVHRIFSNKTVKGFLKAADKVVYREENLDAVALEYIGKGKVCQVLMSSL